jgi:hypothetical protein
MRFDQNAILVDNRTGQKYYIVSYNAGLSKSAGFTESYVLINMMDGAKIQVYGTDIDYYYDETKCPNFAAKVFTGSKAVVKVNGKVVGVFGEPQAPLQAEGLEDTLKYVTFDDTHIRLHKSLQRTECDHEWVTWTGLRGEVTDCTKCKAVK